MLQATTISEINKPIITVSDMSFSFTEGSPIINNYSMIADYGEWVSFMGPSGSGKTTFLNLIMGLLIPQSGSIQINQQPFSSCSAIRREQVRLASFSVIFQDIRLIPSWSVSENIWMPLMLQGIKKKIAIDRANNWLDLVGLQDYSQRDIATLSGGQKQRVAIARALAKEPEILLADEPTGNLDANNTERISQLVLDLCSKTKTTVICVTHDPAVAACGNRIIEVKDWLSNATSH